MTPLVLVDVTVFDGVERQPWAAVRIADGRIAAVGDAGIVERHDTVVDGAGHTVLPGLIDAHVHLLPGATAHATVFGVTTVVDMFSPPELVAAARSRAAIDHAVADVRSAQYGATAPGGHPSMMYAPMPDVAGPDDAAEFVHARIADGADFLKIIADVPDDGPFALATLDDATVTALVRAAHERGLRVTAHAPTRAALLRAVDAGADGIEHVPLEHLDPADVSTVAAAGVTVTPTLATIEHVLGRRGGARLVADDRLGPHLGHFWRDALTAEPHGWAWPDATPPPYAAVAGNLRRLAGVGVTILAGTDAPNPGTVHGVSLHCELELLVEAGLPTERVLQAATSAPAATFGLADRGVIAPGRRADLVLVRGDPLADITMTRDIAHVWRGGVDIDRDAYTDSADEAAEVAALRAQVQKVRDAVAAAGFEPD